MAQYRIHTFETSANLVINSLTGNAFYDTVEYLVVAGGGGGGGAGPAPSTWKGSGGGAGGFLEGNTLVSAQTYQVIVGSGGSGGIAIGPYVPGGPGSNSSVFGSVASGGGGGAGDWQQLNPPNYGGIDGKRGRPGGSGGGSNFSSTSTPSTPNVGWGAGTPGQGNPGGVSGSNARGAGGGGAGAAGGNYPSEGGIGKQSNITGSSVWYAGGGPADGVVPTVNRGNSTIGGGGEGSSTATIPGFSGIDGRVILRYPIEIPIVFSKVSRVTDIVANTSIPNIAEINSNVLFEITAINASNGESLYYYTSGNVNSFNSSNTGTIVLNANASAVTLITSDVTGDFSLNIKRSEQSETIISTSDPVSVVSSLYLNAGGGNVIIEGDYKIHVFLQSNTFQILSLGLDSNISYAVLAGGGGGDYGFVGQPRGAGGGGLIQGNVNLSPYGTGNLSIVVGGGGASLSNGGQSYINNAANSLALFAAGGGSSQNGNGGSGGAIHPAVEPGVGQGIPGQGYPGGVTNSGYGGGGGAGGAGGPGRNLGNPVGGRGGDGAAIPIAPPAYGYFGGAFPQPATPSIRWFGGGGDGSPGGPTPLNTLEYWSHVRISASAPGNPSLRAGTGVGGVGGGVLFSPTQPGGGYNNAQSGIVFIKYKYK